MATLKTLDLSKQDTTKQKFISVPVPGLGHGEDAEITVSKMSVEGYIRYSNLSQKVREQENISDTRRTGLFMLAGLISVMVDPDTRDFLIPVDEKDDFKQLDAFHNMVDKDSLEALLVAHGELNPPKEFKTPDTKKKKS